MIHKKFRVVDLYDGEDLLGYADDITEIKKLAKTRYDKTDGECKIYYMPLDPIKKRYICNDKIFLESC